MGNWGGGVGNVFSGGDVTVSAQSGFDGGGSDSASSDNTASGP
jgi:hypothetical protein